MGKLLSEETAIVANIDPDAYAAAAYDSGWVDMTVFDRVMAIVQAGDLGASATIDASVRQATDSGGTGAKAITGKSITQLTQAGGDSNKQAVINVKANELDVAGDFTHVSLQITVGTATSDAGGIVLGSCARYQPASDNDATTVDEIIS